MENKKVETEKLETGKLVLIPEFFSKEQRKLLVKFAGNLIGERPPGGSEVLEFWLLHQWRTILWERGLYGRESLTLFVKKHTPGVDHGEHQYWYFVNEATKILAKEYEVKEEAV